MKKIITVFVVILMLAAVCNGMTFKNDIVRLHIRANSDSEYDQNVKLLVRDEINEYLSQRLENVKTKKQALSVLSNELEQLNTIAQSVSGSECRVLFKEEYFPEKNYNGKVYPEGEYTALIIEIGKGAGQNWWCVAFPNMCFTKSEKKVEYKSFFVELLERIGVL